MTVTIDKAGRVVIPKEIRDREGLTPGTEMTIRRENGKIELEVPHVRWRIEDQDGLWVIVPDRPVPPFTSENVRREIERQREERIRLGWYGEGESD